MERNELESRLAKIDAATTAEEKVRLMQELAADHGAIDIEQVETFVAVADAAVKMALQEIITVAGQVGTDHVPVSVLEFIATQPSRYGMAVYATVEKLGFQISVNVPDDCSELEGL